MDVKVRPKRRGEAALGKVSQRARKFWSMNSVRARGLGPGWHKGV